MVSDNDDVARSLFERVRVLCWIMTSPENHKVKAVHILATWGKRCNKIVFVSEKDDKSGLPIMQVGLIHKDFLIRLKSNQVLHFKP